MPEIQDSDFVPVGTKTKDTAIPRFYPKAVKNNFRSEREEKAVYDTFDYVEILIPGDRLNTPNRKVKEEDKARWPAHWAAYKAGKELATTGTPLETWPPVDVGQVETLKHWNVRSVEDLANVSDANVAKIGMGMLALRQKAIVWLAEAQTGKGVSQVVAENRRLSVELETLKEQFADLAAASAKAERERAAAPAPVAAAAPIDPAALQAMIAAAVASTLAGQQTAVAAPAPAAPQPKAAVEDSEV